MHHINCAPLSFFPSWRGQRSPPAIMCVWQRPLRLRRWWSATCLSATSQLRWWTSGSPWGSEGPPTSLSQMPSRWVPKVVFIGGQQYANTCSPKTYASLFTAEIKIHVYCPQWHLSGSLVNRHYTSLNFMWDRYNNEVWHTKLLDTFLCTLSLLHQTCSTLITIQPSMNVLLLSWIMLID